MYNMQKTIFNKNVKKHENACILKFFALKVCTIEKNVVILHPILRL